MTENGDVRKRPLKFELMLWALYLFCKVLSSTWRVRIVGMDRRRRAVASGKTGAFSSPAFMRTLPAGC